MWLISVMLGAYWDNGQAWSRFQCLQRGSGLGMGTCEESLMDSKADCPIFISGPGPPMSKEPCQHSVSSQVKLRLECYQETRSTRLWRLNRAS